MLIRGALGNAMILMRRALGTVVLHRQHSCGWKWTPKQPSGPPAPGIPPAQGCARQRNPLPQHRFILTPIYRAHKLPNFPGDLKWGLMADASSMTPSAFPCSRSQCRLLPLGMALTNPQRKVPPELGKELAYLLVFFLPCKHLILIHRKKLGASPWARMFITTTDCAYLHIMRTKCH